MHATMFAGLLREPLTGSISALPFCAGRTMAGPCLHSPVSDLSGIPAMASRSRQQQQEKSDPAPRCVLHSGHRLCGGHTPGLGCQPLCSCVGWYVLDCIACMAWLEHALPHVLTASVSILAGSSMCDRIQEAVNALRLW